MQNVKVPSKQTFAVLILSLVLVVGCGSRQDRPQRVKASGQVRINGQPLASGVKGFIQVVPETGKAAFGEIDPQTGRFILETFDPGDGCVTGTHKVEVIVNKLGPGGNTVSLIDEKYRSTKTSGLTVTIDGPTDDLIIDLEGELKQISDDAGATAGDDPGV